MTRNTVFAIASAAAIAAIAAAAAITSNKAFADDITVDNTPFVSSRSRAEVQAEIMKSGVNEWTLQFNDPQLKTGYARGQARAEYLAARDETRALHGEDSGSFYLARTPGGMNPRAVMGGPAR
jgi:hypothetical protein